MGKPRMYEWITSQSAEKIRRAFHLKGVAYESVEVDFFERKNLIQASHQDLVPMVEHDGQMHGPDTWKLLEWVDETFPGPSLFPNNSRTLCFAIDKYVETILGHSVRAFVPAAAGLLLTDEQKWAFFDQVMIRRGLVKESTRELVAEMQKGYPNLKDDYFPHLRYWDAHFATHKHVLGDAMSAADFSLYSNYWAMCISPPWTDIVKSAGLTNLHAWADRQKEFYYTKLPF